ncbi:MAG: tetratricopeptide repeat protein, partial [Pseudomonadota bacterium]|nr:tetratricopeptide repeat protein [Pseudomonadota bacterium]
MKRWLFAVLFMVVAPLPVWADALDDARAALEAQSQGNLDEAIRLYTLAIDSGGLTNDNIVFAYNNRGLAFDDKGLHDRAIVDFEAAIRHNPDYFRAYYNRGIAYARKGFFDRAIRDYDTALSLNPEDYEVLNQRGLAYGSLNFFDRAIADFSAAIKIKADHYRAFANRGNAYSARGLTELAIADYEAAQAIQPDDPETAHNLDIARQALARDGDGISGEGDAVTAIAPELIPEEAPFVTPEPVATPEAEPAVLPEPEPVPEPVATPDAEPIEEVAALPKVPDYQAEEEVTGEVADFADYMDRGDAHSAKGLYDLAISAYTIAMRLDPMNSDVMRRRGNAYMSSGQY